MRSDLCPLNLPLLHPDETLYSWCGAVHASNGNVSALNTSRRLFGAPYAALLHDFPSHLTAFCERTDNQLGAGVDIAVHHTVLGYYLPFVANDTAQRILSSVQSGNARYLKMTLGIPASRLGAGHPLKACAECIEEGLARDGVASWQLSHQFPSVYVCGRHRCLLTTLRMETTPVHLRQWLMPHPRPKKNWLTCPPVNRAQMTRLTKLAEFSVHMSHAQPGSYDPDIIAAAYRTALRRIGMVTCGGSLRTDPIEKWMHRYYDGLESFPGLEILASIRPGWPGLVALSRKAPRQGHPCKHLLLICALFDSWAEFEHSYRTADASRLFPSDRPTKAERPPDDRFNEFIELVKSGLSISAAAQTLGATSTTGVRWAKLQGFQFTSRAKSLQPPVLDAARVLLAAGQSKSSVCEKTGISLVSINRLLSSEPQLATVWRRSRHNLLQREARQRFLCLLATHSERKINEIRKIPGNGYPWLYRHDRDWLVAHLSAAKRSHVARP
ncbi:TnsD family Tn7-like transposition protein [Caballeronia sp. KNU42]